MGLLDYFKEAKEKAYSVTGVISQSPQKLNDGYDFLEQYEGWTYKAIKTKADAIVPITPKLYKKSKIRDEAIEIFDAPILNDLNRFNDYQTFSQARHLTVVHLALTGTAYWVMQESEDIGHEVDFYVLDPSKMTMVPNELGLPTAFEYQTPTGEKEIIDSANIIYFHEADPRDWIRGYGALQASRYAHNTSEMSMRYNMNMFGNNGRPDMLFVADGIGEESRTRLEEQVSQKFKGINNARNTGVVNSKIDVIDLNKSPKDLDWIGGQTELMKQILAIQGVPSDMLGLGNSTYANAAEAQRFFQMNTVAPMLKLESDILTEQLIPKYYRSYKPELYFGHEDPVAIDKSEKIVAVSTQYEKGIMTRNEAREELGLDPVDGGNEFISYRNQQIEELTEKPIEEPKEEPIEEPIEEPKEVKTNKKIVDREELRKFYEEKTITGEVTMLGAVFRTFDAQMQLVVDSIGDGNTSLKISLDREQADKILYDEFKTAYLANAKYYNDLANQESDSNIRISRETIDAMEVMLLETTEEVNNVTENDLKELTVKSVKDNTDNSVYKQDIINIFTQYSEGVANIDTLKSTGTYVNRAELEDGKAILNDGQRYITMYDSIMDNLTGIEQEEALRALLGVLDPNSKEAERVKLLINGQQDIFNSEGGRGRNFSRTENTKIKNFITRRNYADNPLIRGYEWLTSHDRFVRGSNPHDRYSHIEADGQKVAKTARFMVSGERLSFPGDPRGSAGNIINCRCTLLSVL